MLLEEMLRANEKFVQENKPAVLDHHPRKHLAIVSCMDTRLPEFLGPALGVRRGEALEIKNAGNTVAAGHADVIRSLVGAVYMLGVKEVAVVGHTNCGMANIDIAGLRDKMLAAGVKEEALQAIDLASWIGTFGSEAENVVRTVEAIKASPYLPKDLPVHGLLLDIVTGKLTLLVNGGQKE